MPLNENQRALAGRVSNWGRWGAEDERGALNFITPDKRARAAKLVQSGEIVSGKIVPRGWGVACVGPPDFRCSQDGFVV